MKKPVGSFIAVVALFGSLLLSAAAAADKYIIDTAGMHAFVQFRVKHLGYSWLYGRFNDFSGEFNFDPNKPEASGINLEINTASVDSNHAERDKHLRSDDFLHTDKYPKATFKSTGYKPTGKNTAELTGDLTLHGVTRPVTIEVEHIGGGKDPWGGFRQGFEGRAVIKPNEFGIKMVEQLGPVAGEVELFLTIEGKRL